MVPARRAVVLVLKEKAEVVLSNGVIFRSERVVIEAPSVVRLRRFVHVPYRPHAPLTRRAVFARDAWVCQYCGSAAENLDHVVPRSRGGLHVWENVVAACRRCNTKKKDRTPAEAGFHLPASRSRPPTGSASPWAGPSRAGKRTSSRAAPADARLGPSRCGLHPRPRSCPAARTQSTLCALTWWSAGGIKWSKWRKGEDAWPNSSARTATSSTQGPGVAAGEVP